MLEAITRHVAVNCNPALCTPQQRSRGWQKEIYLKIQQSEW
jgi:hypothetical protein